MIYQFDEVWHDYWKQQLFEGPEVTQKEWEEACKKAIQDSTSELLSGEDYVDPTSYFDLACKNLEKMGFKQITPVNYQIPTIFGIGLNCEEEKTWIKILGKETLMRISKHNAEITERQIC